MRLLVKAEEHHLRSCQDISDGMPRALRGRRRFFFLNSPLVPKIACARSGRGHTDSKKESQSQNPQQPTPSVTWNETNVPVWGSLRPLKESYNLHAQTDTHRLECVRSFRCKKIKKCLLENKKETRRVKSDLGRRRKRNWGKGFPIPKPDFRNFFL